MRLPMSNVTATIGSRDSTTGHVPITLRATHTALFVTLTTLAAGRFSDNVFMLRGGKDYARTIWFIPWEEQQEALLRSSLRVEHLRENL